MGNITTNIVRVMKMVEYKPKYSSQIARLAPDMFVAKGTQLLHMGRVYNMLKRMQKSGLIEEAPNYKPQAGDEKPDRDDIIWYRLTAKGRKTLKETLASLDGGR